MSVLQLEDIFYVEFRREFVATLLMCGKDSDFLVRKSKSFGIQDYKLVLSVMWEGQEREYKPNFDGELYSFGSKAFPTLIELINYHYSKRIPLCSDEMQTMLKRPKLRGKTKLEIETLMELGEEHKVEPKPAESEQQKEKKDEEKNGKPDGKSNSKREKRDNNDASA